MSSQLCLPSWSTSQLRRPQSRSLTTCTLQPQPPSVQSDDPQLHLLTRMSRNLVISVADLGTLLLTVWKTERQCAEHLGNLAASVGSRTICPMSAGRLSQLGKSLVWRSSARRTECVAPSQSIISTARTPPTHLRVTSQPLQLTWLTQSML